MKPESVEITHPLQASANLKFCEAVVRDINRHPKRRAEVKREGLLCQVVDYSRPIKATGHGDITDQNVIIGWEPMDGHIETGG